MTSEIPALKLKKNEDRRLRAGHLWVFSNEVDTEATPLTDFEPGDEAVLVTAEGRPVGTAYVNPHSLISARLVTRNAENRLDRSLMVHRLNVALSLRQKIYDAPCYRLVYGESDGLPGLVVDRYDDVLVAQITTAGMECRRDDVLDALVKVIQPRAVLWRNDAPVRELEGLSRYVEPALGEMPEEIELVEGQSRFRCSPTQGQKTGWFYDQRDNRDRLARYARDAKALDLFSYVGAWGIRMADAGAAAVTCVDSSPQAVETIAANAALNGLDDRLKAVQADCFDFLSQEIADGRRYDLIVLDPPAFAKRKKDIKSASQAYRRLNELAMRLLERDGILVSCSCSYHMPESDFVRGVQQAARHIDRNVELLERLQQGPDHPVHPAIPETRYLKGVIARVTPTA